jgi:hypothetical protein
MIVIKPYHVHNHFTVRMGLEFVLVLEVGTQLLVVVDFTIDAKNEVVIIADQRLSTSIY